jgi:flagellar assembly factor FliW
LAEEGISARVRGQICREPGGGSLNRPGKPGVFPSKAAKMRSDGLLARPVLDKFKKEPTMMTAETAILEPMTVGTENIIHLPLGLLGFERIKKYLLLANPGEEPFRWLQVPDDPKLAFLVISPRDFMPGYKPELTPEDAEAVGLTSPMDAIVLNIVTLRGPARATQNLKGPIVLNRFTLSGKQVIITNASDYSVQHPLSEAD